MKIRILKLFVLPLMLMSMAMSLLGCWGDGVLGVNGSVNEWVDPPQDALSKLYIVSDNDIDKSNAELKKILDDASSGKSITPLAGATMVLGLKKDVERLGDKGYVFKVKIDDSGKFQQGWTIAPTRQVFNVKVSKQGYMDAVGEFENGGGTVGHGILIILVKSH
jgi:hypothetical protein